MTVNKKINKKAISIACTMAIFMTTGRVAFAQDALEQRALETVAARLAVSPDSLSAENLSAGRLQELGTLFYGYKIADI